MDKINKALWWVRQNKIISLITAIIIILAVGTSVASYQGTQSYNEQQFGGTHTSKAMGVSEMAFVSEESANYDVSSRSIGEYLEISPPIYPGGEGAYSDGVERKLIKNGSLSMTVKSLDETRVAITQYVSSVGGFVASENFNIHNTHSSDYSRETWGKSGSLTLKVPTDQFSVTMDQIREMALVVTNEHSNVSDVTEQYTDLETRLKNKKAEEAQYRAILSKAYKISDILETTKYIEQARRDAEQIEGQLNVLSNQVKLSSIHIYLESEKEVNVLGVAWDPAAQIKQSFRSMINSLIGIGNSLIALVLWIPIFLIYVVVYGFIGFILWKIAKPIYFKIRSLLKS